MSPTATTAKADARRTIIAASDANFATSEAIHTIAEYGATLSEPEIVSVTVNGETVPAAAIVTVPDGWSHDVIDLDEIRRPYAAGPRRKAGYYTVRDVQSFLAYFAKHATDTAESWVTPDKVTAVLDAHQPVDGDARWEDHRLILQLTHSTEWKRWHDISGRWFAQQAFAELLEEAAADIVVPDMATILEVAQSLEAHTKVEFESSYRTQDGQRGFKYKETIAARAGQKGSLEIPEKIVLRLRVFEGQDHLDIPARFRYRLSGDDLRLGVIIDRIPEILDTAVADIKAMISDATDRGIVLTGPAPISVR